MNANAKIFSFKGFISPNAHAAFDLNKKVHDSLPIQLIKDKDFETEALSELMPTGTFSHKISVSVKALPKDHMEVLLYILKACKHSLMQCSIILSEAHWYQLKLELKPDESKVYQS